MTNLRALDGGLADQPVTPSTIRQIAAAHDRGKTEDAANLRARLRTTALLADGVYDEAKGIIGDLHLDGHTRAAAKVAAALHKLKQAETLLEEARELVLAEERRA